MSNTTTSYLSGASDLVEGVSDAIPQLSKTGRRALSVNSLLDYTP